MSENLTEPSRVMEPGKVMSSSCTIMPRNAIMAMRPCLISTARRRASDSFSSQKMPIFFGGFFVSAERPPFGRAGRRRCSPSTRVEGPRPASTRVEEEVLILAILFAERR